MKGALIKIIPILCSFSHLRVSGYLYANVCKCMHLYLRGLRLLYFVRRCLQIRPEMIRCLQLPITPEKLVVFLRKVHATLFTFCVLFFLQSCTGISIVSRLHRVSRKASSWSNFTKSARMVGRWLKLLLVLLLNSHLARISLMTSY